MSDPFIPLICPQCGGKIQITQAQYKEHFVVAGNTIMYIGMKADQDGAKCESCGTEFERKTKFQPDSKTALEAAIFLDGDGTAAIISIGGSHTGNIIVGSNNTVDGKKS